MEQSVRRDIKLSNNARANKNIDTTRSTVEGVIIMLISGFLYALLAALVKWGSNLGYSSANVLFYRAAFQIVLALITSIVSINISCTPKCIVNISFVVRDIKESVQNMSKSDKYTDKEISGTKLWIVILCRGIFGACATFTYFESADLIPIGSATTLISLSCISASFLGWIFLKDEITKYHCLALFLGLIGAVLISQPQFIFEDNKHNASDDINDYGYIVALTSALMGGFVYLTIKMAKKSPLFLLILSQGLCCIILSLTLIFGNVVDDHGFKFIDYDNTDTIICIVSLGFVGFGAQWTLTKGAQKLIPGVSSLLRSSTNMACAFLLEMFLFSTYPDFITITGAMVALLAVIVVSMEKIRKAQQENYDADDQDKSLADPMNSYYEDRSLTKSMIKNNLSYKHSTSVIYETSVEEK